ncbi:MAG: hypothetical protein IJE01_01560 [Clostridia bacterium]|nr:hypothetical protein [Clostridia bacterium]
MFTAIISIVVITLIILLAAVCFIAGMLLGNIPRQKPTARAEPTKTNDEAILKAKQLQKELSNMLSYNGQPQEEITTD